MNQNQLWEMECFPNLRLQENTLNIVRDDVWQYTSYYEPDESKRLWFRFIQNSSSFPDWKNAFLERNPQTQFVDITLNVFYGLPIDVNLQRDKSIVSKLFNSVESLILPISGGIVFYQFITESEYNVNGKHYICFLPFTDTRLDATKYCRGSDNLIALEVDLSFIRKK